MDANAEATFVGRGGNRGGSRPKGVKPLAKPSFELKVMRRVISHKPGEEEKATMKAYRAWYAENRNAFMMRLTALSAKHSEALERAKQEKRAGEKAGELPNKAAPDVGSEKAMAVLEKFLADLEGS